MIGARVLVTRASPGGVATMARLTTRGAVALHAPMSVMRRKPAPDAAQTDNVAAVILTSANAAFALTAGDLSQRRVYAVGEATARAAKACGASDILVGPGDATGLADFVSEHADAATGALLYLRAEAVAVDLAGLLREAGFEVREHVAYAAEAAEIAPPRFSDLAAGRIDAVLFQAARAAATFAALAARNPSVLRGCRSAIAVGVSARALAPLAALDFRARAVAENPSEDALFAALSDALLRPS